MKEEKYCRRCGAKLKAHGSIYVSICPNCKHIQFKDGTGALPGEYEIIYGEDEDRYDPDK